MSCQKRSFVFLNFVFHATRIPRIGVTQKFAVTCPKRYTCSDQRGKRTIVRLVLVALQHHGEEERELLHIDFARIHENNDGQYGALNEKEGEGAHQSDINEKRTYPDLSRSKASNKRSRMSPEIPGRIERNHVLSSVRFILPLREEER